MAKYQFPLKGLFSLVAIAAIVLAIYRVIGLNGAVFFMAILYVLGPVFAVTLVNTFKIRNPDHALYAECATLIVLLFGATLFVLLVPAAGDMMDLAVFTIVLWCPQLAYYFLVRAPHRAKRYSARRYRSDGLMGARESDSQHHKVPRQPSAAGDLLRMVGGGVAGYGCMVTVLAIMTGIFVVLGGLGLFRGWGPRGLFRLSEAMAVVLMMLLAASIITAALWAVRRS